MTDQQSLSHLITVQQLRAAGALDCPEWMRKSLGPPPKQTRNLFSDLSDEDHVLTDETNEEDCEDEGEDEA